MAFKILKTKLGPIYMRKTPGHRGYWDVLETRAGQLTGKSDFTGTIKEVKQAIKLGILYGHQG